MLRGDGWEVEMTCWQAPVQLEGHLPTGEPFYFRARHEHASLAVGGDDPSDVPESEAEESHSNASYLPGSEGLPLIQRLARAYASTIGPTPPTKSA
jgi:hypothetical protein